jgi:hypothetical protein
MNTKIIIIAILVTLLSACGGVKDRAESICSSMTVGASISTVEKILNEAGITKLPPNPSHDDLYKKESYRSELNNFLIAFPSSSFSPQRWVCQVDFEQGKVTHHELRFVD